MLTLEEPQLAVVNLLGDYCGVLVTVSAHVTGLSTLYCTYILSFFP